MNKKALTLLSTPIEVFHNSHKQISAIGFHFLFVWRKDPTLSSLLSFLQSKHSEHHLKNIMQTTCKQRFSIFPFLCWDRVLDFHSFGLFLSVKSSNFYHAKTFNTLAAHNDKGQSISRSYTLVRRVPWWGGKRLDSEMQRKIWLLGIRIPASFSKIDGENENCLSPLY